MNNKLFYTVVPSPIGALIMKKNPNSRTAAVLFAALILSLALTFPVLGEPYYGYSLYNPMDTYTTSLVNMNGTVVKTWANSTQGGYVVHLLEDGLLLRPCRATPVYLMGPAVAGKIQKINWSNTVVWTYTYSTNQHVTHHDVEPMPNGNVLLIAWEVKTAAQATAAGRQNAGTMWPDHIIEVQPSGSSSGTIVWEWHVWDHLVQQYNSSLANYGIISEHPELMNINLGNSSGDWMHVNGISYNPDRDEITFSSHYMNEIYVIDHSTTTAEAATHSGGNSGMGGDFLYRWGKPSNYNTPGSQYFYVVHCAKWVPAGYPGEGNLLAFNNGTNTQSSKVAEIVPPIDSTGHYYRTPGQAFGPAAPVWTYSAAGFYSDHLGSCQRLPNGNTFCDEATSGDFVEVSSTGQSLWTYNTTQQIAKAYRYPWNYSGVVSLNALTITLTPQGAPIQIPASGGSFSYQCSLGNSLSSAPNVDYWAEVTLPNGTVYGPVYMRTNLNLAIGGSINRTLTQNIPANAPAGTYTFRGFIGDYPDFEDAFSEFTFAKLTSGDGGTVVSDWNSFDTGEQAQAVEIPQDYTILTAYPNPFNPTTTIAFNLNKESEVSLIIYDTAGRVVSTLSDGFYPAGEHRLLFDGSDLTSGVYFARLNAGNSLRMVKLLLVK